MDVDRSSCMVAIGTYPWDELMRALGSLSILLNAAKESVPSGQTQYFGFPLHLQKDDWKSSCGSRWLLLPSTNRCKIYGTRDALEITKGNNGH